MCAGGLDLIQPLYVCYATMLANMCCSLNRLHIVQEISMYPM